MSFWTKEQAEAIANATKFPGPEPAAKVDAEELLEAIYQAAEYGTAEDWQDAAAPAARLAKRPKG